MLRPLASATGPLPTLVLALWLATAGAMAAAQPAADQCITDMAESEALSGQLDILSWNIQKSSNLGWEKDLAQLSDGVNLAFIQEASLQAGIPQVFSNPLYQAFARGYTTAEFETGVLTLSSSSPSLRCHFTSWEPWLGTPKATSVTEFPLAGRSDRLLTINLHAVNFALGLEDFRSQFQALADMLTQHEGPVILAGDLNTWSQERQLLVDAFTSEFGLAPVAFNPDLRTTVFGHALDHIYVRGMHATAAKVVPVATSDHNPLLVRLAFN
ncbi:MAG: endonuclease/exonuclease/phosphatase family protein [Pseudomonadales bacterium]|nr:endonuclease/exonuclease/phosphatase family protein [Halioglobus sp.]MCP5130551.1 endonuclease/exonuclease/phosphatase family protein [Pseudomonadales bacterium]